MIKWQPNSWRSKPIKQYPTYPNAAALSGVEAKLKNYPELVSYGEVLRLKSELAKVCEGKAFLLQGGDCAESFGEFNDKYLRDFFKVLLQMTMVLMYGTGLPVVKVGRIAGQFAKPRSADTEVIDGKEYPSYRGDMINAPEADVALRQPDPERLLTVYHQSAATLNYLRSLASGGYAALAHVNQWNLDFAKDSKFSGLAEQISEALRFLSACGLNAGETEKLSEASFYSSHEGLHLGYEEALTRGNDRDGYFACSAHMLWIGDRTKNPDEAHVEFMRGLSNPVASKVGPSTKIDDLLRLIDILNPHNEPGKLTLISRMGASALAAHLPQLVRRVKAEGKNVIWSCDPMHGNTEKASNGYKTRHFDNILSELKQFFEVHKAEGTYGGGVHFEMTGADVTECLGGSADISVGNLEERYKTACDPRLNASQALELAFLIAKNIKQ